MFQAANATAARTLKAYLKEMDKSVDFEAFTPEELDLTLKRFYVNARTRNGELYRGKSLQSIRYGINRYLQSPPHSKTFDIIKDARFNDSNNTYKTAMAEIKNEGKGDVQNIQALTKEDIKKLYESMHLDENTPAGLANKVQFDVRLFFMRRGLENMASMTKSTFTVKTDENGDKYVCKTKDEMTKNNRTLTHAFTTGPTMPATGGPKCPVTSFEKYIQLLSPNCDRLWVQPKSSFTDDDDCWFTNRPLGHNALRDFLPKLSSKAKLSQRYTNHSLRATGITLLSDANFSPIEMMAASGHRNVQSLATYQKTSLRRKIEMGRSISHSCTQGSSTSTSNTTTTGSTAAGMSNQGQGTEDCLDLHLGLSSSDIEAFFDEANRPTEQFINNNQALAVQPFFRNCHIGKIEITYNFNK